MAQKNPDSEATLPDLGMLIASWRRHLAAANLSPRTIKTYLEAAEQFAQFIGNSDEPVAVTAIGREEVEAFIQHLLDTRSASTAESTSPSMTAIR